MIRKRGLSTEQQLRGWRKYQRRRKDLGYAGKIRMPSRPSGSGSPGNSSIKEGMIDESLEVLRLTRNQRKLKIGQLAGNRFEIRSVVRRGDLEERIQLIATKGYPTILTAAIWSIRIKS